MVLPAQPGWLNSISFRIKSRATASNNKQLLSSDSLGENTRFKFFIYLDNYPNMQTIAGSYLGVSTGLLQLLKRDTPDNAQLNGLVAHELARDIQKEGFITAWKNEDLQTLKSYELFYDAVATATMNHL